MISYGTIWAQSAYDMIWLWYDMLWYTYHTKTYCITIYHIINMSIYHISHTITYFISISFHIINMSIYHIYSCCDMIWKWYEICYGTRNMINWHVYDMIYCDAICYGMICKLWNIILKAWNVMLCLLNCMYTTWYEWHEITINSMKYNPVKIMHDMRIEKRKIIWYEWKTIAGLCLIM